MLDIDVIGKGVMLLLIPMGAKYFIDIMLEECRNYRRTIAGLLGVSFTYFLTIHAAIGFFNSIGIKEGGPLLVQVSLYCIGIFAYLRLWRFSKNKKYEVIRTIE